jgi:hypothetical protein
MWGPGVRWGRNLSEQVDTAFGGSRACGFGSRVLFSRERELARFASRLLPGAVQEDSKKHTHTVAK